MTVILHHIAFSESNHCIYCIPEVQHLIPYFPQATGAPKAEVWKRDNIFFLMMVTTR